MDKDDSLTIVASIILYLLIISSVVGIYWFFHCIEVNKEKMENAEMAQCTNGQYSECMDGWLRVEGGSYINMRAAEYEEAYFQATGKMLISDPKARYSGRTDPYGPTCNPTNLKYK